MGMPRKSVLTVVFLLSMVRSVVLQVHIDSKDLYERVTEGLIETKKQHPTSTAKIYTMLDQVDKLYSYIKQMKRENDSLKQELQNHHNDSSALKSENEEVKGRLSKAKQSLMAVKNVFEKTNNKLEHEKNRVKHLEDEQKTLLARIDQLESDYQKKEAKNNHHKAGERQMQQDELLTFSSALW